MSPQGPEYDKLTGTLTRQAADHRETRHDALTFFPDGIASGLVGVLIGDALCGPEEISATDFVECKGDFGRDVDFA